MSTQSPTENRFAPQLYLLSATFFFIFAGAGAQQAYLVRYLGRVTDWGPIQCSMVIASVYFAMLVFRVANVYLFPNWSDRRFTIVGSLHYLLFTVAMAIIPRVQSYPLALACALLWGAGGAMMWTGTTMQTLAITDRAGGRHGTGMGVLYSSTNAGWLTGAVLLGVVYENLATANLHQLYVLASGITLIGIVIGALLPATAHARRETPPLRELLQILRRERALISGFLLLTRGAAFGLIIGVFADYIETSFGEEWVWITVSFYPAGLMVMSFLGGHLTDRANHSTVLALGFATGATGLLATAVWPSPMTAALAAVALAVLSTLVPIVATAMVGDAADRKRRPLAYGVLFSWRDLGVAGTAVAASAIRVTSEFRVVFVVFTVVFTLCAGLSLFLRRFSDQRL